MCENLFELWLEMVGADATAEAAPAKAVPKPTLEYSQGKTAALEAVTLAVPDGYCYHIGEGENKGLFVKKCSKCGTKKDY